MPENSNTQALAWRMRRLRRHCTIYGPYHEEIEVDLSAAVVSDD